MVPKAARISRKHFLRTALSLKMTTPIQFKFAGSDELHRGFVNNSGLDVIGLRQAIRLQIIGNGLDSNPIQDI